MGFRAGSVGTIRDVLIAVIGDRLTTQFVHEEAAPCGAASLVLKVAVALEVDQAAELHDLDVV
jgi:hypothetical protein